MLALKHSLKISRERLDKIAWWLEFDLKSMTDLEIYNYLVKECNSMYHEITLVINGSSSTLFPEMNTLTDEEKRNVKEASIVFCLELECTYI